MDPDPNTILTFLNIPAPKLNVGLLVAMVVLLMFSFLFSSIETAYSTFNKIRMKNLKKINEKLSQNQK